MQTNELIEFARHCSWADATVWQSVLGHSSGAADPKILGWQHHIHTVQWAFLQLWRGDELVLREQAEFPDAAALAGWGCDANRQIIDYLESSRASDLERHLEVPWSAQLEQRWGKEVAPVTVAQSVVQVSIHTAHHRGQVAARLRAVGGVPPTIDYIVWLWLGQPAADWPERLAARDA